MFARPPKKNSVKRKREDVERSGQSCVFCRILSDRVAGTPNPHVSVMEIEFEPSKNGLGIVSIHRIYSDGPVLHISDGILVNTGIHKKGELYLCCFSFLNPHYHPSFLIV
jgi:hypothetical protein